MRGCGGQGLFPGMERKSGIRKFSEKEIEALRVIECLKKAGMEIKDIRQFMDWCVEGPSTSPRNRLFRKTRANFKKCYNFLMKKGGFPLTGLL